MADGAGARVRAASMRQSALLELIRAEGRVEVAGLSAQLGVSGETLRRDLRALEGKGLIGRSYGRAEIAITGTFETGLEARRDHGLDEKLRLAKAGAAQLGEAKTVFLDEGFTPQLIAAALPENRGLTVVTPSLPLAADLVKRPGFEVLLLGGRLRDHTLGVTGEWVKSLLADLVIDLGFIGANGISLDRGLTTPDPAVAVAKRAAIDACARRVLCAAHYKFDRTTFIHFADIAEYTLLITGRELSLAQAAAFNDLGPRLLRV